MESHMVTCVLSLSLLIHLCPAAPGLPGTQREESADVHPPSAALPNPFGSGEEERRLLQSYIQSSLKDGQGGPEITTWEQEVFFLFGLHDYDRSGFLDGLEMMKLLSDYSSHHTPGTQASEPVVSMVDFLLHTQDQNQDGLLAPSELLSPPLIHKKDSNSSNAAQQDPEKKVEQEEKPANTVTDQENAGAVEQREEEAQEERHPEEEDQPQHEVKMEEDEAIKQTDEQQIPEAPAAQHEQDQRVPVHQGQPEI
ncbi:cell growth regulator with EF hand domain protein 1 [Parambassis ranga]|uniref:Cell growth regulator with EF hand domain protein 1 n=1 Tax=Parambassis ranga TaxID=210632 RepID=A0A6P7ICB0_9TELE|nr:cell growth regulator with EF hand domain protein 1 [Parambassis ranga]